MALKTPFWKRKYEDVSLKDVKKLQRENDKKFFIFSIIFAVVISTLIFIKFSILGTNRSVVDMMAQKMKDKNVKIAVIHRGGADSFSREYFLGSRQEGNSMGIKIRTLEANYDLASFRYLLVQAGEENYDGVIINGGNGEVVEEIKKIGSKGIPIVAFDSTSKLSNIKGITMTSQDHHLIMEYALSNMFKELNGKGNIVYLYAKTYPSLVTCHKIYEQFLLKNLGVNEVERFDIGLQGGFIKAKHAVSEMLKKYGKGKINAIFSTYGEMTRGAAEAIKEAGRKDIKIYGVGFTDADLYTMQGKNSPYVSATGTYLKEIGTINIRLLLKKIAGEETPSKYKFKPSLITQNEVRSFEETIDIDSLNKVVRGWGKNDDFEEDWMKKLKESKTEKSS